MDAAILSIFSSEGLLAQKLGHSGVCLRELRNQAPRRQAVFLELFEEVAELGREKWCDLAHLSLDHVYLRHLKPLLLRRRPLAVVGSFHRKNTCPTCPAPASANLDLGTSHQQSP